MSSTSKGLIMAIIAPLFWGLMAIFIRPLYAAGITSMDISFIRCFFGGVMYYLLVRTVNPQALRIGVKGVIICMLYGICSYGVSFVACNIALTRIPLAVSSVLIFTNPVWVTILNLLFFKERPDRSKTLAIGLCFIGAILVTDLIHVTSGQSLDPLGIIMSLVNAIGVAAQLIIPRFFDNQYERDSMISYGFLGAALGCLLLVNWSDFGVLYTAGTLDWRLIGCLLAMGILCTFIANGCYVKATDYIDTMTTSIFAAIQVVVNVIVGCFVFGEIISTPQAIGAVIIVAGALYPNIKAKLNNPLS